MASLVTRSRPERRGTAETLASRLSARLASRPGHVGRRRAPSVWPARAVEASLAAGTCRDRRRMRDPAKGVRVGRQPSSLPEPSAPGSASSSSAFPPAHRPRGAGRPGHQRERPAADSGLASGAAADADGLPGRPDGAVRQALVPASRGLRDSGPDSAAPAARPSGRGSSRPSRTVSSPSSASGEAPDQTIPQAGRRTWSARHGRGSPGTLGVRT